MNTNLVLKETNNNVNLETNSTLKKLGRGSKKNKKKVVILLQPPSIYLPTPLGVQKATFLIFF